MKMVAAAKLRRAQDAITQMRPYATKLNEIIANLAESLPEDQTSVYSTTRPVENVLILVISSDRGLCGAFNGNIFKFTNSLLAGEYARQHAKGNVTILPVGRKANDYFGRRHSALNRTYSNLFENLAFDNVKRAAEHAMAAFEEGKYDKVVVVYNEFKNVATQILRDQQLLPLIKPTRAEGSKSQPADYIFNPSAEAIMEELIPKSIKVQLYKALLDSNAAEQGARMTAMDKATDNAGELLKSLKLTYNRSRQAAITKEILEIVGGAEALNG